MTTWSDIPILSQKPYLPPAVQAALDKYSTAVEDFERAGNLYESIRYEARTTETIQDYIASGRIAHDAWEAYCKIYNTWIEYPDDFEIAQETIELRNL